MKFQNHRQKSIRVVRIVAAAAAFCYFLTQFILPDGKTSNILTDVSIGLFFITITLFYGIYIDQNREQRSNTLNFLNEYTNRDTIRSRINVFKIFKANFATDDKETWIDDNILRIILCDNRKDKIINNNNLADLLRDKDAEQLIECWLDISVVLSFWSRLSRAYTEQLIDQNLARKLFRERFRAHYDHYLKRHADITDNPYANNIERQKDYWKEHIEVLHKWLLQ